MSARAAEQRLRDFQAEREDQSLHDLIREQFEADRKAKQRDGVTVQQFRDMLASFPPHAQVVIDTWDDQGPLRHNPIAYKAQGGAIVVIEQGGIIE